MHYRTRLPKFGRDLAYHYPSCDLYVTAAGKEVYRLNLEQGKFMNAIVTSSDAGCNCIDINPAHQLIGIGTEEGVVEFWDPRSRERIGALAPGSERITSLKFHQDGLNVAVGTHEGKVLLYDMREARPWMTKDHHYDLPIRSLNWVRNTAGEERLLSADKKVLKIWDAKSGEHFTSIEPVHDINDVCPVDNSGLIYMANEGIQMQMYYIPQLGNAPRWCSFLDNLTEEMEETPQDHVYDNYRFVSRAELATYSSLYCC
jgi:ribosome biogenesis protein ENP2